MTAFAVQYLENVPGVAAIPARDAQARLHDAFERLPISHVLLGWNLPQPLVRACREETRRAGAQFYRWHPLLTGDGLFFPRSEWQTVGLGGEVVPGFQGWPEFTFVCPNQSGVGEAVLDHLYRALRGGDYDGVFLDRIRYPSPAADLGRWLACFCDGCRCAASEAGLDLEAVRQRIRRWLDAPQRIPSFLQALLGPKSLAPPGPDPALLHAFLDFRARSVQRIVRAAADLIHGQGLAVGLDCFSPALTRMVGQDLGALDACSDWIKVMTYGHTLGPAGLPFELLALADWLMEEKGASETQALEWLSLAAGFSLPPSRVELREQGLAPSALSFEVGQARAAGVRQLWAGVELVEIEGVAHLDEGQIEADLGALYAAGADGLALSWDLWHMPLERLELVAAVWAW
ncbi:MAG: hypothetical protein JSV36_21855 [Anaerolineae bacterium]|nr:MAG: hypothetical protein JSV36_21855 [Anaerolineae bacterium]